MRRLLSLTLAAALAAGCALPPAQAQRAAAPAAAPAAAIDDVEPEVTKDVAAALARKGAEAGTPDAALLRACPAPLQLELLRRSVDGEERSYLYRVRCPAPLLASATYGKNGAIKRLTLQAEPAGYAPGR
ncbi:hypothetical protein [Pseudoduganella sp. UC29_71]|uniref:hypothetical protein n=1 Tax=Pseudoduganella sp. UC29_71 TaxID=3350174 RepID=UPI00366C502B